MSAVEDVGEVNLSVNSSHLLFNDMSSNLLISMTALSPLLTNSNALSTYTHARAEKDTQGETKGNTQYGSKTDRQ